MGSVLSGSSSTPGAATPTASTTPTTGTAAPSSWLSALNPFKGVSDFLPNAGLVIIGVVLAIAALVVSQKETVIQVAKTAAEV
jgi:hypothetical protein